MPLWQPQVAALLIRRPGLRPLIGTNFTSHRPADTYGRLIYDATPVAYYRLDGDTTDLMGNAAGVLHGTAGYGTAVVSYSGAQAGSFNGSTDYVQVPDQVQSRLGDPLTVEAWVVPTSTSAGFHGIAGNTDALMERAGANFTLFTQGVGTAVGATTITAGQTYHVVATWDGHGTAALYVNGVLDGGQAYGSVVSSTAGFFIGSFNGASEFFDGQIDEVAYYNRALSLAEVQAHYAAGGPAAAATAGQITLDGTATAAAAAAASGSIALSGTAAGAGQATGTGSITLSGTGAASARPAAAGSITLAGTGTAVPNATAAGSITLAGSATAGVNAIAAGSITLAGTATAGAQVTATGTVTLSGTATGKAQPSAAGQITLGGTAAGTGQAAAAGSITLGGTAAGTPPGPNATGAISLSGTATAQAAPTAAGSITLGGTTTGQARADATGAITLGGAATAGAGASSDGSITLAGAGQLSALAQAAGQIQLDGLATWQPPFIGTATAADTLLVNREGRVLLVLRENRTQPVPADSRTLVIGS